MNCDRYRSYQFYWKGSCKKSFLVKRGKMCLQYPGLHLPGPGIQELFKDLKTAGRAKKERALENLETLLL